MRSRLIPRGDDGATAAEYALLVAGVVAVIVLVVFSFGRLVNTMFTSSCDTISTTVNGSTC